MLDRRGSTGEGVSGVDCHVGSDLLFGEFEFVRDDLLEGQHDRDFLLRGIKRVTSRLLQLDSGLIL